MKTTLLILIWCAVAVAQPSLPNHDADFWMWNPNFTAGTSHAQLYLKPIPFEIQGDDLTPANIIIHTNYTGTIQIGTNLWTVADLLRADPIVHSVPWMSISTTNAELISMLDGVIDDWFTNRSTFSGQQKQRAAEMAAMFTVPAPHGWRFWRDLPPGNQFTNPAELSDPQLYPLLFRIKP